MHIITLKKPRRRITWKYQRHFIDKRLATFPVVRDVITESVFTFTIVNSFKDNLPQYEDIARDFLTPAMDNLYRQIQYRYCVYQNTTRWKDEIIADINLYLLDKKPLLLNLYRNIEDVFFHDFEEWKKYTQATERDTLSTQNDKTAIQGSLDSLKIFVSDIVFNQIDRVLNRQDMHDLQDTNQLIDFDGKVNTEMTTTTTDRTVNTFFDNPQSLPIQQPVPSAQHTNRTEINSDTVANTISEQLTDNYTETDTAREQTQNIEQNNRLDRDTDTQRHDTTNISQNTTNDTQFDGLQTIDLDEGIAYDHHIFRKNYNIPQRLATLLESYNLRIFGDLQKHIAPYFLSTRIDVASYD